MVLEGQKMEEAKTPIEEFALRIREFEVVPENVTIELLVQLVDVFSMVFCDVLTPEEQQLRNLITFGTHSEVEERFRCYSSKLRALKLVFDEKSSQIPAEQRQETESEFGKIASNIFAGRENMVHLYMQMFTSHPDLARTVLRPAMEEFYQPVTLEDMKGHHKLILFYLLMCQRRKYRKIKEQLYEPCYTNEGHFTHFYKPTLTINEFIYDAIYPYNNHPVQFMQLTDRAANPKAVVVYLTCCKDDKLPFLQKRRTLFSYRNGVYDAETDHFYLYEKVPDWPFCSVDLPESATCCNYLDYVFDYRQYEADMQDPADPLTIQTPHCQTILNSQEFDPEVCRWSYASIGRLIFPVGLLDNWQYFLFYKGTAGSGKSTLLSLAALFFEFADVGYLMAEGQQCFSIEHLYDKFVFFCMDADEKMNLSQTRWNQMVSGEMVAVERKFKIALATKWETTGAFAGNGYPPWVDRGGNVSRRFLVFLHDKVVTNVDPQLMSKCKQELPAFMKKCVACYHYVRRHFGHKGIWDDGVLPAYFHNTKKDLQAATNSLQSFLLSDDMCSLGPTKSCDFSLFRNQYNLFCNKHRVLPIKLVGDTVAPVWKSHNITRVMAGAANPVLMGVDIT